MILKMGKAELNNLAKIKKIKPEEFNEAEYQSYLDAAKNRLSDARRKDLSSNSRFDLAYGAAHSYARAALRYCGYRSDDRYILFQVLEHTVGMAPNDWRVLAKCHNDRNLSEYQGETNVDLVLVEEVIAITTRLEAIVTRLPLPPV
jgi:hypothetical protein